MMAQLTQGLTDSFGTVVVYGDEGEVLARFPVEYTPNTVDGCVFDALTENGFVQLTPLDGAGFAEVDLA